MSATGVRRHRFAFRTVRGRFLVPSITLLFVLLGGLGGGLIVQNDRFGQAMLNSRCEAMAEFMGKVGSGYISYYNLRELDNLVEQATKDPDTVFAAFYDEKGGLLTQKAAPPREPPDDPMLVKLRRSFNDADGRPMGSMLLVQSRRSLVENTRRQLTLLFSGMALVLLLFVLGMSLLTRSMVRPLLALTRAAEQVARDGDLRQTIQVESGDEVGRLALSFQQMIEKQRRIQRTLVEAVGLLTRSIGELSEQTSSQSEATVRQSAAIHQTEATAEKIGLASLEAASEAKKVLEVAQRAEQVSHSGEVAIGLTAQTLAALRDQMELVDRQMTELGQRAHQIGEITESVKELADQSNMLALNAAIEAARSGAHGKGFAVVAREIRSLADQSLRATARVKGVLDDISQAVGRSVEITREGIRHMESGLTQVKTSDRSLQELAAILKENAHAVQQISASVELQKEGIAEIFSAVTEMSSASAVTLARIEASKQTSQAVDEVTREVSSIANSFQV